MDQNELMRNIRATQSMVFGDDGESNIYFFTRLLISCALQKYIMSNEFLRVFTRQWIPTYPSIWISTPPRNDVSI